MLEYRDISTVSKNYIQGISVSLKYRFFGVCTAIAIVLLIVIINVSRKSTSEQKGKDQGPKDNDNEITDVTVYYAQCKNNSFCENELYFGKRSDDYKTFHAPHCKESHNQPVSSSSNNKPRQNDMILQRSYSLVRLSLDV